MKLNWINRQDVPARSVALGTFDGVHRGHQKLLEEAIARKPQGGTSCVFTFDIPPVQYFRGTLCLVSTFERRVELFRSFGIDEVAWLKFGPELTNTDAQYFVEEMLVKELKAREVICGFDYRFGKGRVGDVSYLREQGERLGFSVTVVPPVQGKGAEAISSTAIRGLLKDGSLAKATEYLGYFPTYRGAVKAQASSHLTLEVDPAVVIPGQGVYLIWYVLPDGRGGPAAAWNEGGHSIGTVLLNPDEEPVGEVFDVLYIAKLREDGPHELTEADRSKAWQLLTGFHLQDSKVVLK
nr:bifunctional riboflavin kinase/FAD synthetase [Bacillota bacterium]